VRSLIDARALALICAAALGLAQTNSETSQDIDSRVRALYERGEWAEAARVAVEAHERSADVDLYRGLALARLGKLGEAELAFLDGHRMHRDDSRFGLELAGIAYRKDDKATAKRRLMEALRLDPSSAYGNDFLGTLFLLEGNLPATLKYWNRIDKPLIQNVQFAPALNLQPVLRERTLAISPGQVLTLDRLWTTETHLDRLDILASYQFDLTPRQDQRFDLTLRSLENSRPLSGWPGKVLPYARGLPYQTIYADFYNLDQRAINFTAFARWDPDKRRIAASLAGPIALNPHRRYRFSADIRDEQWDLRTTYFGRPGGLDDLILRKIEVGAEIDSGLTPGLSWASGLWVARRRFQNGDPSSFFQNSWSFQLRNSLNYRLWTVPERRVRTDASLLVRAGRVLTGAPSRFVIAEGGLSGIWFPLAKGEDLEVGVSMRGARTFGALPLDEYFYLGMERDNDLWLRGHLGARDGRKGTAPLGTEYSLFKTELSRTVFKFPLVRVQLGPFFDAGRIGDPSGRFGSRGWMEDTGLQVKIKAPGNLTWTLVYGRNLRDRGGVFYTSVSR